uniref:Uncharacterized protein n=1 Tax=Cacopsylla melanoneura TaxID=428564 RepID=A0A8D8SYI4_9HEMI
MSRTVNSFYSIFSSTFSSSWWLSRKLFFIICAFFWTCLDAVADLSLELKQGCEEGAVKKSVRKMIIWRRRRTILETLTRMCWRSFTPARKILTHQSRAVQSTLMGEAWTYLVT